MDTGVLHRLKCRPTLFDIMYVTCVIAQTYIYSHRNSRHFKEWRFILFLWLEKTVLRVSEETYGKILDFIRSFEVRPK